VPFVKISPKYQIVIPKSIREELGLRPGQRVHAVRRGDRIEVIPLVPMERLRGLLRGIDTSVPRDEDRV
jgi:AbrB family looped-hinge helix DNA binding protein